LQQDAVAAVHVAEDTAKETAHDVQGRLFMILISKVLRTFYRKSCRIATRCSRGQT